MKLSLIALLASLAIVGCGTTHSLNSANQISHAVITMKDGTVASGEIISEFDDTITISSDGNLQTYTKTSVGGIVRTQRPDLTAMQEETLRNSARAASNSGMLLGLTLLGFIASIIVITK